MPFGPYSDFADCIAKNSSKSNPQAYCAQIHHDITGQWPSQKESRSTDFNRIYDQFLRYYMGTGLNKADAEKEYYQWLSDIGADESKAYAFSLESFSFASQLFRSWKEDQANKYYKVLVAFPIQSMNRNVYTEDELRAFTKNLLDVPISLNHEPTLSGRPWILDGAKYAAAEFETGASEAILQVPKSLRVPNDPDFRKIYPGYAGKRIHELIDEKEIVNQSLEWDPGKGFCGSTLLTKDHLPGIPMSRIKPLESIMVEALQRRGVSENQVKKGLTMSIKIPIGRRIKQESAQQEDASSAINYGESPGRPSGDLAASGKAQAGKPPEGTTVLTGTFPATDNSKTPVQGQTPSEEELADARQRREHSEAVAARSKAEIQNRTLGQHVTFLQGEVNRLNAENAKQREERAADAKKHAEENAAISKKYAEENATQREDRASDAKKYADEVKNLHEQHKLELEDVHKQYRAQIESANTGKLEAQASDNQTKQRIKSLEDRDTRRETQVKTLEALVSQVGREKETLVIQLGRDKEDLALARDSFRDELEKLKPGYDDLNKKYAAALNANLELSKTLRTRNEELNQALKENDEYTERLKKARVHFRAGFKATDKPDTATESKKEESKKDESKK